MFKRARELLIKGLLEGHINKFPHLKQLFPKSLPAIDHLAIIDLNSDHSGISYLSRILCSIGFVKQGDGYLLDKKNDFIWLRQEDFEMQKPENMLPQIVLADFRMEEIFQTCSKYNQEICLFSH